MGTTLQTRHLTTELLSRVTGLTGLCELELPVKPQRWKSKPSRTPFTQTKDRVFGLQARLLSSREESVTVNQRRAGRRRGATHMPESTGILSEVPKCNDQDRGTGPREVRQNTNNVMFVMDSVQFVDYNTTHHVERDEPPRMLTDRHRVSQPFGKQV